jgi:hypothetical protein
VKVVLFATRFAQLYFDHLLLWDFLNMHDIHMVLFFFTLQEMIFDPPID